MSRIFSIVHHQASICVLLNSWPCRFISFCVFFFKQNVTNLTEQNMYSISFFIFSKSKRICIFHFSTLSHQKLNRNSKQKYKHWALKFVTFLWLKYFMLLAVFVTIPELDCSCFLSWSIFVDRCFFVEFYDT